MPDYAVMNVLLHAPTPDALQRARNNASNLLREMPEAQIKIIANAQAVDFALDAPHEVLDSLTWLCPNTLQRADRQTRQPLQVLPRAAVLEIAQLQRDGWLYIRA